MPDTRPLIVRCGAFGDMVLLTPLIRGLYAAFQRPVDLVTSGPWSAPLLRGQPGVGDIFTVRSRKTPFWLAPDQRRLVRELRARGIGPTWFCDGNDAAMPLLRRAGIGDEWIVAAKDHRLLPGEHATEQWQRLARVMPGALGGSAGAPPPDPVGGGCELLVNDGQRADLDAWLRGRGIDGSLLFLIQMGNKRTMRRGLRRLAANSKHWPAERWAAVLRYLRVRFPAHSLLLLGTGPEYAINQEVASAAAVTGLHNVADALPIPRLVALLARAGGLLTVDSGPAHAGAAVGCPQVVLFGKALPSLYRPWGTAGADVKVLCGQIGGEADMLGITIEQVIEALRGMTLRAPA